MTPKTFFLGSIVPRNKIYFSGKSYFSFIPSFQFLRCTDTEYVLDVGPVSSFKKFADNPGFNTQTFFSPTPYNSTTSLLVFSDGVKMTPARSHCFLGFTILCHSCCLGE